MLYNSNKVLSWSDSRILDLYKLSRTSSGGILVKDNKISSHLVSNSWTSSLRRVIEKQSAWQVRLLPEGWSATFRVQVFSVKVQLRKNSLINQEPQMVQSSINCNQFSCHFWWDVVFDRWSSGMYTHHPHRAPHRKELPEFLQETLLWRICPIAWHTPSLLLWFPLRSWPSSPSSDSLMSSSLQLSRAKVCLTDYMDARSWINHKLFFFQLFCWRSGEYPFFRWKVECSLVFFCELVDVF